MSNRYTKPYSAPPFPLAHHPGDPNVVTMNVPGHRQARNYACGYASALMVLRHFGKMLGGSDLFSALGTARDGTGQTAIVRVLRSQGLRVRLRYDMEFFDIKAAIDAKKLLIGYLEEEEHWLVVYGYGEAPQRVFVADPDPGNMCEHAWHDYGKRLGQFGMLCSLSSKGTSMVRILPGQQSFDFGLVSK